jgi:hypothetical protein
MTAQRPEQGCHEALSPFLEAVEMRVNRDRLDFKERFRQ